MRKLSELDRILENAVARAIGVKPPHADLKRAPRRAAATRRQPVKHAA